MGGGIRLLLPHNSAKSKLKILAKILADRLQLVTEILLGPEQNCAVKGCTIQGNVRVIRLILEDVKDDDLTALINFDQCKSFDRVEIGRP